VGCHFFAGIGVWSYALRCAGWQKMRIDWGYTYIHFLPLRTTGDPIGDCVEATQCYCAELLGILAGYTPRRLSELDLRYRYRGPGASQQPTNLTQMCVEEKWPITLIGTSYDQHVWACGLAPNATAVADRVNQVVTQAPLPWTSLSDCQTKVMNALVAGHPLSVYVPQGHEATIWGGDSQYGVWGVDNRDGSGIYSPGVWGWSDFYAANPNGVTVYTGVVFSGPKGPAITTPLDATASRAPSPYPYIPPPVQYPGSSGGTTMNATITMQAPGQLSPGQPFSVTFQVTNTGTWPILGNTSFRLGSQNPANNGIWHAVGPNTTEGYPNARVQITQDIPPGATVAVIGQFTAPATINTYTFSWQCVQEGVTWFGQTVSASIQVYPATGTQPPTQPTSWTGNFTATCDASGKLTISGSSA
jgi:hypothetical protein